MICGLSMIRIREMHCVTILKHSSIVLIAVTALADSATCAQDLEGILQRAESSISADSSISDDERATWKDIADSLLLLDSIDARGRVRMVIPDARERIVSGANGLRELLRKTGSLDEVQAYLEKRADASEDDARKLQSSGELSNAYAQKWRAAGLRSVLGLLEADGKPWAPTTAWSGLKTRRASENLPLVTWGAGSYLRTSSCNFVINSQAADRQTLEIAEACELTYAIWKQLFYGFWAGDGQAGADFEERSHEPYRVVLFRTRESYIKALRAMEPRIGISTGYYSPTHRTSFFYFDGAKSLSTLVHELTHQFFNEATGDVPAFDANKDPGFWVIEGVALYMESISSRSIGGAKLIDVGGWDAPRLQAGRYRRLHDEFWIPTDEFFQAGGERFRNTQELPAWYSQACGLTHSWLDESSESRDAFLGYLRGVYRGKGAEGESLLGDNDDSIRLRYDRYLLESFKRGEDARNGRPFFKQRDEAILSNCEIASEDLLAWDSRYRKSAWLDLAGTAIDDRLFLEAGETPWEVVRLGLESTKISDASMPLISKMSSLTELDLTNCNITDEGLKSLEGHPSLRTVWLAGTKITDDSLKILASIPKLERTSVEGASVSAEGWRQLLLKKPLLKRKP
ncbi:MAG: hypothetical protein FJ308_12970 [Planctomycetes bacterium]|nr:hypothetical protein [Planctomycetota bacterium]